MERPAERPDVPVVSYNLEDNNMKRLRRRIIRSIPLSLVILMAAATGALGAEPPKLPHSIILPF